MEMAHFDEMTCMQYLDGQLDRSRAAELAAHAEDCAECRRLLKAIEGEASLLHAALTEEDEPVPARLLSLPSREVTPWAWITAFAFACLGLYTLWTGVVEPWLNTLSQAGFGQGNLLAMLFFNGVFWKGWSDMLNLVQLIATVTLGVLGITLLVRGGKRWTTVAMVMGALLGMLALPPAASAAEIVRSKESYTLADGKTLDNDLILMCGSARIDGTLNGDLIAFGNSITINGHVTGDVISFSERLAINGTVDGNVRAFTSSFNLKGQVAKNVLTFVSMFDADPKAQIGGGVIIFVSRATFDGRINRDILGFGEHLELNGFVGGNAQLQGGRLNIGPDAEVKGKVKFRGRQKPEVDEKAKLSGPPEFELLKKRGPDFGSARFYLWKAIWWAAAFLFGLVVALVAPGFFRDTVRTGNNYLGSLGAGLVALILTPVVALIVCITVVGIPLGIALVLLWLLTMYMAQIFLGAWLGTKMMGEATGTGALLGRLAAGLLLIHVVVNIPYVGGWARFVVLLLGMGAIALTVVRKSQPQIAA